jgi:hypothetical protein
MNGLTISGKKDSEWVEAFEEAGPSIQLRLRSEVFRNISLDQEQRFAAELVEDPRVIHLLQMQDDGGWFFHSFHGYDSMESSIRYLVELGLPLQHPSLQKAAYALHSANSEQLIRGIGKVGFLLEEKGVSGHNTIRAWLLALLGFEDCEYVNIAVRHAENAVHFAASVDSIIDITISQGRYLYLKNESFWPDLYTFRLLAATKSWQNSDNKQLIGSCVENMCRLQPIPALHVYAQNRPVAPGAFGMQVLTPDIHVMSPSEWMPWFQRMNLFAQLGVLSSSKRMSEYYEYFQRWLTEQDGWFKLPLQHTYFSKWGAYTGLMLEQNWRKDNRRKYDLTFRCLLLESGKLHNERNR